MRLIDADELNNAVRGIAKNIKRPAAVELACLVLIAEQSTVDAMDVIHGEWTVIEDDYNDDTIYQCSVCKEEFVTIDDTPADNLWNYCPNCGAKMDLVTECEDDYDYLRDRCYECGGYGDDYYTDENGDLVSACDDCPYNGRDSDDD